MRARRGAGQSARRSRSGRAAACPRASPETRACRACPHRSRRAAAGARCGDRLRARSRAHRADIGGVARTARQIRRLRVAIDRDATGVRRRQSEGARDVRRRGARPRRGHRGAAVRRPLRKTARPHDRRDRPRPQHGLYRQCHSVAAARQPHADAAGDADLPALHPAPDRAGEPGRSGHARQSLHANAARHARRHHAHPRQMGRLRHRHAGDPRAADLPSGLSVALAVLQADVVAGFARDREGARRPHPEGTREVRLDG